MSTPAVTFKVRSVSNLYSPATFPKTRVSVVVLVVAVISCNGLVGVGLYGLVVLKLPSAFLIGATGDVNIKLAKALLKLMLLYELPTSLFSIDWLPNTLVDILNLSVTF